MPDPPENGGGGTNPTRQVHAAPEPSTMAMRAHRRAARNLPGPVLYRGAARPPLAAEDRQDWRPIESLPATSNPAPHRAATAAHCSPSSRLDRGLRSARPPARRHENRHGHGQRPGSPVVSEPAPTTPANGGLDDADRGAREGGHLVALPRRRYRLAIRCGPLGAAGGCV
jgi:hypothetical protein